MTDTCRLVARGVPVALPHDGPRPACHVFKRTMR